MAEQTENPQSSVVIEARGLTKVFKDFWGRPKAKAVNGIDFTVNSGHVFGLLGPNGSGKSTTVKMLLGLLYPTRGQLTVLGESPERVDTKRRIGYLPEDSYLYPYLTAAESLDFFGALFGLPGPEREKRCKQLLDMVGLTSARNRPVGEFSKGMARRIGLAQALVNDPELVILDEPTAGLDPIGCREVKDVISLLAERGKTVILCSHLLADVEDVCDELVVLYGGRICARGGLQELLKIEDRTRILTPRLEKGKLEEVLELLRETLGNTDINVDHPAMNLEELFLDVVRKARESTTETAGAEVGGEIAAYLRQDTDAETEEARHRRELLRKLSAEATPAKSAPQASAKPEGTQAVATEQSEKLTSLTQTEQNKNRPENEPEKPRRHKENEAETDQEASERLKKLLGNADQQKRSNDGEKDRNQKNAG